MPRNTTAKRLALATARLAFLLSPAPYHMRDTATYRALLRDMRRDVATLRATLRGQR